MLDVAIKVTYKDHGFMYILSYKKFESIYHVILFDGLHLKYILVGATSSSIINQQTPRPSAVLILKKPQAN